MEYNINEKVFMAWGFFEDFKIQKIGNGHINNTYKLTVDTESYVLQEINSKVFKNPQLIIDNTIIISEYLKTNFDDYLFIHPIKTIENQAVFIENGRYWRLVNYIQGESIEKANNEHQVYEAAKQYATLTKVLKDCKIDNLQQTIPHFHDLLYRYDLLLDAIHNANPIRYKKVSKLLAIAQSHDPILIHYKHLIQHNLLPIRIMHHDAKIGNILFDDYFCGICVVDIDTLIPGNIISDIGDMMRTCLSPVDESSVEFEKIESRLTYFEAIIRGYFETLNDEISTIEVNNIVFGGKYMVFMQAIRFLTDYLNNDQYYPIQYATQNYNRAKNQFILLGKIIDNEKKMEEIILNMLKK